MTDGDEYDIEERTTSLIKKIKCTIFFIREINILKM